MSQGFAHAHTHACGLRMCYHTTRAIRLTRCLYPLSRNGHGRWPFSTALPVYRAPTQQHQQCIGHWRWPSNAALAVHGAPTQLHEQCTGHCCWSSNASLAVYRAPTQQHQQCTGHWRWPSNASLAVHGAPTQQHQQCTGHWRWPSNASLAVHGVHAGTVDPSIAQQWTELARRVFERSGRAMIAYLDNYAIPFAAFMAHFLRVSEGARVPL